VGAARNGRKNERVRQHRGIDKSEVHRYPCLPGSETYEPGDNFSSGVVSGTEATQYGIKVFNLQERNLLYRFGIYKMAMNPVNHVNPGFLSN